MPPTFTPNIQWTLLTHTKKKSFQITRLRGFHPLRQNIPVNFNFNPKGSKLGQHHISTCITTGDSVCSTPFSLAVTHGIAILLSLPLPTKMFQFGRFPLLTRSIILERMIRSLIRQSRVQRMHAPRPGNIAACRDLHRQLKPSHPPDGL